MEDIIDMKKGNSNSHINTIIIIIIKETTVRKSINII